MKILIVCSGNSGTIAPFIQEQADDLMKEDVKISYFLIKGKGIIGYLKNYKSFKNTLKNINPKLIHAHYGLSGLFANLQFKTPVITTYHGSDVNNKIIFLFSRIAFLLSSHNIFVSRYLQNKAIIKRKSSIIPCAVDLDLFFPQDKTQCRKILNLDLQKKYILFPSAFSNVVKNHSLALEAINLLYYKESVELLELKEYNRNEVCLLMNAVDISIMTSFSEGSSQFIKEAMACNCPIVSTDVGDVQQNLRNLEGCYITSYESQDVAKKLDIAFKFGKRTNGRKRILELGLDSKKVAKRIISIYKNVIS